MPSIESAPEQASQPPAHQVILRAYDRAWNAWQTEPSPRTFAVLETGIEALYHELAKPGKFTLGQVLMTVGASEAMLQAQHVPPEFLLRHMHGDWGDLCAEDRQENEQSLRLGNRLLSSYHTRLDDKLWIITEWDRSATTLLLPGEY